MAKDETRGSRTPDPAGKKQGRCPPVEHQFKPGQSGNPQGRPMGSRNKLGEDFLAEVAADFAKHGAEIIEKVRKEQPAVYMRVVASLLPSESRVAIEPPKSAAEMSDAELMAIIEQAASGVPMSQPSKASIENRVTALQSFKRH